MKKNKTKSSLTIIVLMAIVLVSCENFGLRGIRGTGAIVSETKELSLIEGLKLKIPATVYLTKGDEQSISIEAQQNVLENIETRVNNEVLTLEFDKRVAWHKNINIYITLAHLKHLTISGSGSISSESNFTTENKLYLYISGSGNIDVAADAPEVELGISGSGNIKLKTFTQNLRSNVSGSGDIILAGKSEETAYFETSGSGNLQALSFETTNCSVSTVGSGDAKVTATKTLEVQVSGSGDVAYKGNPILNVNINGSGKLISVN